MSKTVGLDRAVEYVQKLEKFRAAFEAAQHKRFPTPAGLKPETAETETGRKFDKVFINTSAQRLGRYMVDRNSWTIYGIKSWQQVNERRTYGSLDTVAEWDWAPYYATPLPGTDSEKSHLKREAEIVKAVLFLVDTDFVTGEVIRVDGGRHLR